MIDVPKVDAGVFGISAWAAMGGAAATAALPTAFSARASRFNVAVICAVGLAGMGAPVGKLSVCVWEDLLNEELPKNRRQRKLVGKIKNLFCGRH